MSNLFGGLSTDGLEETQDRLGGFRVLDTGPYGSKIKAAYAGTSSSSKAQSVTIIVDTKDAGEYRETIYVTDGEGKNFYFDKQDKAKKHPLPGWTTINDICLVTLNKELNQMVTEEKVMNVWDKDAGKEIPKSVPMLVELIGKEVTLGIVKEAKFKQKKGANGYEDTDETREENSIDKVFHVPSNLTVVEAKKGIQTATFYGAWVEKNKGVTRDKRKGDAGGQAGKAGRPGMPPKAGDTAAKTTSLFG